MNIQHFIDKFRAIPDSKWAVGPTSLYAGFGCALWHCSNMLYNYTYPNPSQFMEGDSLREIFESRGLRVSFVNDGAEPRFQQATPKARILAALESFI